MLLTLLLVSGSAQSADSMALELGKINHRNGGLVRLSLQRDWGKKWFMGEYGYLGGYWEVDLGYWQSEENQPDELYEIGFTPVFRLQRHHNPNTLSPYLEIAIGAHVLSQTSLSGRQFSTSFQLGEHIGLGFGVGDFDFSYRLQHISNAGIKEPNSGINFHILRVGYPF